MKRYVIVLAATMFSIFLASCGPQYVYVQAPGSSGSLTGINLECESAYGAAAVNTAFAGYGYTEYFLDGIKLGSCHYTGKKEFIPVSPGTHKLTVRDVCRSVITLGMNICGDNQNYVVRLNDGQIGDVSIKGMSTGSFSVELNNFVFSYEDKNK